MGVDHGRLDVFVPEQFLNGPDVVPLLQEVGGEGVAEGVARRMLGDPRLTGRELDSPLDEGLIGVMAPLHARPDVDPPMLLGEEKLPAPFRRGGGYLRASA
jgi:hypothetical protein